MSVILSPRIRFSLLAFELRTQKGHRIVRLSRIAGFEPVKGQKRAVAQ